MNQNQQKAVNAVNGPVICISGPGSGKTTVIVNRLRHMISDLGITPSSILVITFTKAAAIEMRTRFLSKPVPGSDKVNFGTFHSIFFHILKKKYSYGAGNIISADNSFKLMLSVLSGQNDYSLRDPEYVKKLLDEVARFKSLEIKDFFECKSELLSAQDFERVFNAYAAAMKEHDFIDFEDMLFETEKLLKSDPAALSFWQDKFRYILVDEFQDINPVQYRITRLLAAPQNNLFVVGDDDQSIYSFRGSAPQIMNSFVKDYPAAFRVYLDVNYRSRPEILAAATSLISHNKLRFKKELSCEKNSSGRQSPVGLFTCASSDIEYKNLAREISAEIKAGRDPKEIAVLTRTNLQSGYICAALLSLGIPFSTKAGIPSVYDNVNVRPLLAYLHFASGDSSRKNFLQFMNKPVRWIERASLENETVDVDELIAYYSAQDKWYVVKELEKLKNDLYMISKLDPQAAIHYLRNVTGYDSFIKDSGYATDYIEETLDILDEFEASALGQKTHLAFFSYIEEYKEKLKKATEKAPADAVNILTFHGCKGLEFDSVYIPDCSEGLAPHRKAGKPDELEEERRMFYVAMTRAREKLTLSRSDKRHGKQMTPSRFIKELTLPALPAPEPGTRISHQSYGSGTVLKTDDDMVTVKFDRHPVPKKLSWKFCLEKGLAEVSESG